MTLKVLLITRNYPPKTGGLETYSYNLIREFEAHNLTYKIVLRKSIAHLLWFIPYCFSKAYYITCKNKIESIHLCDALLAPLGILLKRLTDSTVTVSVHGLDITYPNILYQWIIPLCVAKLDRVICVSRSTRDECIRRRIPEQKCMVIPNGIRPGELQGHSPDNNGRSQLEQLLGTSLQHKHVLLSLGRLVKRKGIAWFIESVMPHLDTSYCYLIAGDGPEAGHLLNVIKRLNLRDRIFMLGRIPDRDKRVIYNASDIFVMPNITVPGDIEGFGIAAIEAGSCGLPVIASNIQGIRDAVIHGKTGYLVGEGDTAGYLDKIRNVDLKKEDIQSAVHSTYDWSIIYQQYLRALMK